MEYSKQIYKRYCYRSQISWGLSFYFQKIHTKPIADNDLAAFTKQISKKSNWNSVPKDRFNRRKNYLAKVNTKKTGAKKQRLKQPLPKDLRR